jgi:hypothetical protein
MYTKQNGEEKEKKWEKGHIKREIFMKSLRLISYGQVEKCKTKECQKKSQKLQ